MYLLESATKQLDIQEKGISMIINLVGSSLGLFRLITLKDTKRALAMWQDAFPCKLKVSQSTQLSCCVPPFALSRSKGTFA